METEIKLAEKSMEDTIKSLVKKADETKSPAEAVSLTQAACNVAHVMKVLSEAGLWIK